MPSRRGPRRDARSSSPCVYLDGDFPGCESFHLPARGIEVSSQCLEDRKPLAGLPIDRLMAAAVPCTGEADFLRRITARPGPHCALPPHPGPDA